MAASEMATALKRPRFVHPRKGETIGTMPCPDCGNPMPVRINTNGNIYKKCLAPVGPSERCYHDLKHGRLVSAAIIREFETSQQASNDNEQPEPEQGHHIHETATARAEPEPEPEPERATEPEPEPKRGGGAVWPFT